MNRRDFLKFGVMVIPAIGTIELGVTESPNDTSFWNDITEKVKQFNVRKYGADISEHPALARRNSFVYSPDLFHICVAQAWNCTPSELSNMSYGDRVSIYAWYVSHKQMEAVERYEAERKNKKR